jgi:hypothetical protein
MWWALRIMRSQNFPPDEVRWRKQVEALKDELASANTEARVRVLVRTINGVVHQLNTMGTNAINSPVSGVTLEHELARLRERQGMAARSRTGVHAHRVRPCRTEGCGLPNPAAARFCRRCGAVLA